MTVEISNKDIFSNSKDYSFVRVTTEDNKFNNIKKNSKLFVGKNVTFGIYKKNLFERTQWLFNVTNFEEGLNEILPELKKIKYLAIETKNLSKSDEEILNIIKKNFNNSIKIKIHN